MMCFCRGIGVWSPLIEGWRNTCLLALFKENEHEVPKTGGLVFNCGSCA